MPISIPTIPHFTTWNRLEGRNRETEFDRSLKAEIRDPLWMLTRQWQFGEFQAEDTGSAIFARMKMKSSQLDKYSQRGETASSLDTHFPLEVQVEREKISTDFDLSLRLEMGQHLLRMVKRSFSDAGFSSSDYASFKLQIESVPGILFAIPSDADLKARIDSNPQAVQALSLIVRGNGIDGGFVYSYLTAEPSHTFSGLLEETGPTASVLDLIGASFVEWFLRTYSQPTSPTDTAWNESQLEYQFACSAPTITGENTVLSSEEYYQGRLDWYNFDYETDPARIPTGLNPVPSNTAIPVEEAFTVLPTSVRFAGMPNARWWEMEDAHVDLGDLRMGTTELGKVIFAEFGLIYSNDWLMIPHDLPAGSLTELEEIIITDAFGQKTKITVAETHADDVWDGWKFFRLGNRDKTNPAEDTHLFLPPGIYDMQESAAIEEVNFIRDDMANMVWAIETTVPDDWGGGIDGFEAGIKYRKSLVQQAQTGIEAPNVNIAKLQYQLATQVPENWIPFIPVRKGAIGSRDTQLQRASMPRIIPGTDPKRIRPRTSLLRQGFDANGLPSVPYLVFEEEVPRSGVVIKQSWQRTRAEDGSVIVWQGRRKHTGRIAASSGLQFDQIVPKEPNTELSIPIIDPTQEPTPDYSWKLTTTKQTDLSIGLSMSPGASLSIDWGDGVVDELTIANDEMVFYSHTYQASGPYTVEFSAQIEDFLFIRLQDQEITSVEVDQLTSLTHFHAHRNQLTGLVDLSNAGVLQEVRLYTQTPTSTAGLTLEIKDTEVLLANDAGISNVLNLASCQRLRYLDAQDNSIQMIVLPPKVNIFGDQAPLEEIHLTNNMIAHGLDLSGYVNLTHVRVRSNQIPSINTSNLPALKQIWMRGNRLSGLIDLSQSLIMDRIEITEQGGGTSTQLTLMVGNSKTIEMENSNLIDIINLGNSDRLELLSVDNNQLTSLEGLDACENLEILTAQDNQISILNLPPNTNSPLKEIYLSNNQITHALDLSGYTNLEIVHARSNQIPSINTYNLPSLKHVWMRGNQITGLVDLSLSQNADRIEITSQVGSASNQITLKLGNTKSLEMEYSKLVEILNLADCDRLELMNVSNNQLASLDGLNLCENLEYLNVENNQITSITLPPNVKNSGEACPLKEVSLTNNSITHPLDLSGYLNLEIFQARHNQIPNLKVDNLPALKYIWMAGNQLTGLLDFSLSLNLDRIEISSQIGSASNQLILKVGNSKAIEMKDSKLVQTLDLTTCDTLALLSVTNNQLTDIVLPTNLTSTGALTIKFENNQLGLTEIEAILDQLLAYGRTGGTLNVRDNPGTTPSPTAGTLFDKLLNLQTNLSWTVMS